MSEESSASDASEYEAEDAKQVESEAATTEKDVTENNMERQDEQPQALVTEMSSPEQHTEKGSRENDCFKEESTEDNQNDSHAVEPQRKVVAADSSGEGNQTDCTSEEVCEDTKQPSRKATPVTMDVSQEAVPREANKQSLDSSSSEPSPGAYDVANPGSRVLYNAVPSMNSQANDRIGQLAQNVNSVRLVDRTEYTAPQVQFRRQTNSAQSSLYHRNFPARQTTAPSWYTAPEKPIRNIVPAPPLDVFQEPPMVRNGSGCDQYNQGSSPNRRVSVSTPYVGSHVIASETGPSMTVLLRRPTSERQWGFTLYGGSEYGCPPFVNKVTKNSLAFQHGLEVGDVIVSICKALTVGKTQEQLKAEILRAGNDLDLILIKRGVDLNKIIQIVPQVLQSPVRSPPPSVSCASPEFTTSEDVRSPSGHSFTRGRSFRSVKTKSIRILEEQLATGQTASSTQSKRQQYQATRSATGGGSASSFTHAYGQDKSRFIFYSPNASRSVDNNWPSNVAHQPHYQESIQPNYERHQYSPHSNRAASSRGNSRICTSTNWDTQSERGAQWTSTVDYYARPTLATQDQGNTYVASSSMTIPLTGYHERQGRPY